MSDDWRRIAKNAALDSEEASVAIGPLAAPARTPQHHALTAAKVVSALEQFQECVRYLNTRRSRGAVISLESEKDVQDVLFLMLRPWLVDLVPENPTDRVASRYAIKDFVSRELGLVVEAKYVRDRRHGKEISRELHDDIETYRTHPDCRDLVFFIYDRDALIPDAFALRRQIAGDRTYEGGRLTVHCVIKP